MTRLPESSSWEEEIELISRSERVAGGLDGPANRPLKSLASRTRYLKDQADTADESIAEKVGAVKTFAEGATLESPREEILFGSYRLVWTGNFPKTVLAGSTPQGTGGIGAGCWAYTSDAVIRQNLSSGESGLGGTLVNIDNATVRELAENNIFRKMTRADINTMLNTPGAEVDV
ncbi:tail fiber/spike domain-containing protein, partial [Klebsiella pneumoniae]